MDWCAAARVATMAILRIATALVWEIAAKRSFCRVAVMAWPAGRRRVTVATWASKLVRRAVSPVAALYCAKRDAVDSTMSRALAVVEMVAWKSARRAMERLSRARAVNLLDLPAGR